MPELPMVHILVAEDNAADVMLLEHALKQQDIRCKLLVLKNGDEAMRFFGNLDADSSSNAPDLVLLDLHLPKHDGEEILRRLRTSPRCHRTPVVVMSSSDSPQHRAESERNRAHYFRKPIELDAFMELGTVVKRALAEPLQI